MKPLPVMLIAWCLAAPAQAGNDWPSWRGPTQDGRFHAPGFFPKGEFGLEQLWQRPIGQGYSSLSVADGKILTTFAHKANILAALDAKTGREIWRFRMGDLYEAHDGGHDGPVSTPVVGGNTVYALGTDGRLFAVNLADGKKRWEVSLRKRFRARTPFWGFTTTPVIADDLVIVQAGGSEGSLVALDTKDGSTRWKRGSAKADYRSPVVAVMHGRRQLVASADGITIGVEIETGKTLWEVPFGTEPASTPVVIGQDRVLIFGQSHTALYEVVLGAGPTRELWQTQDMRRYYAAPVHHQGYLYGFSSHYLTCLDAATGERKWRSRAPGGRGIIVVDDHLVIHGADGSVVAVEASPSGYREKARVKVSDADGYSWPCAADGTLYIRNLKHIAAVRPTDKPVVATIKQPATRFAAFIRALASAKDKTQKLDSFMKSQESFPIIEDGKWVHFVYRGPVEDVGISGTMIDQSEEDALERVAGTDLFHRTYAIEPGARWEYQFIVDFEKVGPDPLNPHKAEDTDWNGRGYSQVVPKGWRDPPFLEAYQGPAGGETESFRFDSAMCDNSRSVQVYLPPGYAQGNLRYPVVYVTGGDDWVASGRLINTLDQLVPELDAPIVVFVNDAGGGELGGGGTTGFARMMAQELVPKIDAQFRTRAKPQARIILGHRRGAVAAVFTALANPKVFGHCAAISYGRADTVRERWVREKIRSTSQDRPRFYVTWNRYEVKRPQSFDVREQSQDLVTLLKQHGFTVLGGERLDSACWSSWRIQAGESLLALLGK